MPMGMIFVPSRGGLSHCPEEWTDLDQCVTGVTVLANALQRLSE
jgi:N-carbamoyl-L-amino-acid hydrolase